MHCSSLSRASWHASAKIFASFRLNFPGRLDENLRNGNFIVVTRVPDIVSQHSRNLQPETSSMQTKVIRAQYCLVVHATRVFLTEMRSFPSHPATQQRCASASGITGGNSP